MSHAIANAFPRAASNLPDTAAAGSTDSAAAEPADTVADGPTGSAAAEPADTVASGPTDSAAAEPAHSAAAEPTDAAAAESCEAGTNRPARARRFSLGDAIRQFYRFPGPLLLTLVAVGAIATRLVLGSFGLWDLALAAAIVAIWPMQEWLIHVFVLHARPIRILGRTIDFHNAKEHRKHHQEPDRIGQVFIPFRTLLLLLPLHVAGWLLLLPTMELGLTGLAVYVSFALTYEWTHYLIHTPYRPRTRFYRRLWQNHRLHHYRNGHRWYGVSMLSGDRIMGTAGSAREVPRCPSAADVLYRG